METINYEDFCKEIKCMQYEDLQKLMSMENLPEDIALQIEIIENKCKQCSHTKSEFHSWFKRKLLVYH